MATENDYITAIKNAAITIETNLVMGALATVPFFTVPIVSSITKYIVNLGISWLVGQEAMGIFFMYTDFRVSVQGQSFIDAAIQNAKAQTPEEKARAEANLILKFRAFAKFTT